MTNPIYQTMCTEDDPIRQDFWMDVSQEAYEHLKDKEGVRCRVVYPGPVEVSAEPVAWRWRYEDSEAWAFRGQLPKFGDGSDDVKCEPLYANSPFALKCLSGAIEFMLTTYGEPSYNAWADRRDEIIAAGEKALAGVSVPAKGAAWHDAVKRVPDYVPEYPLASASVMPVSVPDEVGLLSKAYPQPIDHYQRVASNLANLWADGSDGARTCILSELLQAAQPRHVAAPKEPGK